MLASRVDIWKSMRYPINDRLMNKEDARSLRPGDIVTLPDGAVAAIEQIDGTDAYVVEWTKQVGRGPWIFPVSDLALVS